MKQLFLAKRAFVAARNELKKAQDGVQAVKISTDLKSAHARLRAAQDVFKTAESNLRKAVAEARAADKAGTVGHMVLAKTLA